MRKLLAQLPDVTLLRSIPEEALSLLRSLLLELRADALQRSGKSWATHKAPLSSYWAYVAVFAGVAARLLRGRA